MLDPFDDADRLPPRRRRWVLVVAIGLVVAVAAAYGINSFLDVAPDVLRPAGDRSSFAFLSVDPSTGKPVRYDPCSPIHYVVDRRLAPPGMLSDLDAGIASISDATGIEFSFDGYTTEPAGRGRRAYQPHRYGKRWAPVLVSWVRPSDLLVPGDQAVGAAGSTPVSNDEGVPVYVTGEIT
ncbi:MAG TPA: hypothetical protein VFK89_10960, partial [Actinomycetota bacterium]|nr:hypothetical protein [Actinomycetota bacterium]